MSGAHGPMAGGPAFSPTWSLAGLYVTLPLGTSLILTILPDSIVSKAAR